MADYDEDWIRASIPHFSPNKIGWVFCRHKYKESLLREIWDYFDLNSKFWMRNYHFSLEFLREVRDRMHKEFWHEIIIINDVLTKEEKEKIVKEFNLPYVYKNWEWEKKV